MPELPEVETMRRGIAAAVGSRIGDLRRPPSRLMPIKTSPSLARFRRRVIGRQIHAAERVGKRVVVVLRGEDCRPADRIVFEPRMSGLVLLGHPPDTEHLRLVFELSGRRTRQLLFWDKRGLGSVRLVSAGRFARDYGHQHLGPDALEISLDDLRHRLGSSRRAIKVALLDQKMLAGVGNIYASEILHHAGIHPQVSCNQLRPGHWRRLHSALGEVLREAIRLQGSTLRDGTYRIGRNRPGSYQIYHRVYQRNGQKCLTCGRAEIVRIVQVQRSTFFCPRCQGRPAAPKGQLPATL